MTEEMKKLVEVLQNFQDKLKNLIVGIRPNIKYQSYILKSQTVEKILIKNNLL